MRKNVIFIMGSGHSGSSLLEMILASHNKVFTLGELTQLHRQKNFNLYKVGVLLVNLFLNKRNVKLCSICEETCSFWNKVINVNFLSLALIRNRRGLNRLIPDIVRKFSQPYSYIFTKLPRRESILIDSSKSYNWISKQCEGKEFSKDLIHGYLIYIVRDGRAILNSVLRKYPDKPLEEFCKNWLKNVKNMNKYYNNFTTEKKMKVKYEELANNPHKIIKSICKWLKIEFNPKMISFWKYDHHPIEGNIGVRSLLWKRKKIRKEKLNRLREINKDYYDKQGFNIKLDLRWKKELPMEKLKVFERIAGSVNKEFEY